MTTGTMAEPPRSTERHVLVLSDELLGDEYAARAALRELTGGTEVAVSRGADPGEAPAHTAGATLFADLGIAVVAVPPERADGLAALVGTDPRFLAVEPERILHALEPLPVEYLRGFRDAADFLYSQAAGTAEPDPSVGDTPEATWGLQVTGVLTAAESGQDITVAILDTGLDLAHPDFAGRDIESRSFVAGETVQDGNGHGTHCAGTACGALAPTGSRRYGVAHEARILVGKVLSDEGSGTDTEILAGISWAIAGGAQLISMSLGADVPEVSTAYETVGRRALAAGCLIVAAAGNNASRSHGDPGFVGIPANSPSIMAVGAVDDTLAIADFSAASNPVEGGQVDLAGPGVDVYSSWPEPERYLVISGTSMATPHVAGIAALWAQRSAARGEALWAEVIGAARPLPLPATDVGAGLVQAPPAPAGAAR